jgi:hypothetical protein
LKLSLIFSFSNITFFAEDRQDGTFSIGKHIADSKKGRIMCCQEVSRPCFPFLRTVACSCHQMLAASVQRVTRHFSYISPHYLLTFYWADTSTARSARAVSRRLLSFSASSPRDTLSALPAGASNKFIIPILTIL